MGGRGRTSPTLRLHIRSRRRRFMDEIIMRCVCFPPWPSELLVWRTKKEMFPSNGDENSTHGETKRKECSK